MSLNLERLIKNTITIQKIPAPTFQEDERAEFLYNCFVAANAKIVEMDAAGNVYAQIIAGQEPPIIVSAHLDTVFGRDVISPAQRRDGRLYGPGVGDNGVALAALLELAYDYQETESKRPLWLVANVGEEGLGNLLGMQHVLERFGERVVGYLVLEGMALGHIYHQGLPVRRFRITVSCAGGHAWIHAGRPSAIHELVELARKLLHTRRPRRLPFSVNLGRIVGGTSVNSLADEATLEIDLRSTDQEALDKWIGAMERQISKARTEAVQIKLEAIGHRPGGAIPEDHYLVQYAVESLSAAGLELAALDMGSTDASLPLSFGLPAVCVGLTNGGGAHSLSEFIEIEPLAHGYRALRYLIEALLEHQED